MPVLHLEPAERRARLLPCHNPHLHDVNMSWGFAKTMIAKNNRPLDTWEVHAPARVAGRFSRIVDRMANEAAKKRSRILQHMRSRRVRRESASQVC